jgi:hypothetical protein
MNLTRWVRGAGSLMVAVAAVTAISRWIMRAAPLKQRLAVPTYYGPKSKDWDTLASAGTLLGIVVINPFNGPSYTLSEQQKKDFQDRINAVGAEMVLGYVTTNYRDISEPSGEPPNTVQRVRLHRHEGNGPRHDAS